MKAVAGKLMIGRTWFTPTLHSFLLKKNQQEFYFFCVTSLMIHTFGKEIRFTFKVYLFPQTHKRREQRPKDVSLTVNRISIPRMKKKIMSYVFQQKKKDRTGRVLWNRRCKSLSALAKRYSSEGRKKKRYRFSLCVCHVLFCHKITKIFPTSVCLVRIF